MPLPGGPADKFGNRYEHWWTVLQLVRVIDGQATSIRIEAPAVNKAEFVLTTGDHQGLHQAKRSHPNGKWSLFSLGAEGLLQAMFDRLSEDSSVRFVFVSGSDAPELRELTERAASAENLEEFETEFVSAEAQEKALGKLRSFWRDTATAYEILQRIEVRTIDERGLEEQVQAEVVARFLTKPDEVCDALRGVVEDSIHKTIDREFLISTLQGRGFPLRKLTRPNEALPLISEAAEKNRQWFADRFKDARLARSDLGQPLAPNDAEVSYMTRDDLVSQAVTQLQSGQSVVLLGDEGCGKSWLAAKIIEQQEERTLTALFSAEHLPDSVNSGQAIDLLARQLIRQTDDDPTDDDPNEIRLLTRWRRRINAWHERVRPGRFLIVLDGLNQRPEKNWGRIIEMFQYLSEKAGGRLLVTCRSHYFRTKVEKRLFEPLKEIAVPEWTAEERDALLKRSGVDPAMLDQQTAKLLLNPRILGIALKVLSPDDEYTWRGLTVERLLFEHIRASERDNADHETSQDFADRLTRHAQEVSGRVQKRQREDLLIFEGQLEAVAEGRFFAPIAGPKNAYELRQEGLSLALGFALVDRLLYAQRNGKDLPESINITLDPFGGLDATPKVVLAALTAITLEKSWFKQDIYEALIGGFALLQNPDRTHYPAFVSLAKEQVEAFLNAAETLTLQRTPHPNFDWIRGALFNLRDDEKSQSLVASTLTRWLSSYTLNPEHEMLSVQRSSVAKSQEEIKEKRSEIKAKRKSLSQAEEQILGEMCETPEDPTSLAWLAITLLTGTDLAPFARALVRASFSVALNGDTVGLDKQFRYLLSLNTRDWVSARQALLDESRAFRADDSSPTGKWALVSILYSTGEDDDARKASALVKTLREPWWPESWRLVEDYCSVDPCDPASEKPANVVNTATDYQQIDVTQIHLGLDRTRESAFLEDALPAIARFFPKIAVEKHLELLDQLFIRGGFPLRQIAVQDGEHRPLIDRERALRLVDILRNPSASVDMSEKDRRIVAQYMLLFAFPLLTASEQLEAMLLISEPEKYFVSLWCSFKSLDADVFESGFLTAVMQDDRALISVLLGFAQHSETPLTSEVRSIIGSLVKHETERIRADVFETIYRRELSDLLPAVIASEWRYTNRESGDRREAWYGSRILIDAARQGLADPLTVLDYIRPESFSVAAHQLGPDAATKITRRLFVRKNLDIRLLEKFSLGDFDTFYGADPGVLVDLADSFLASDGAELSWTYNVALLTAYAISKDERERAKSLFEMLWKSKPGVGIIYGPARLMLDHVTLWKSAANPLLDELRRSRLDQAVNDHGLAMEVLAAEQAGRHDILDAYIKAKCSSDTPAIVARGLMVAGFCDDREEPARVLAAHAGRAGLIGTAHSAAEYAFERNRWARHWYQKMAETDDPMQYWINKCLFAKIVDGRFYLWKGQTRDCSSPLFVYHEITEEAVKRRSERWKQKREKKLFGQDAPEPLFVQ